MKKDSTTNKQATRYLSIVLLLLMLLTMPLSVLAQQDSGIASDGLVTLDFKDVELQDLIQTISELTGENFLYDDSVKGKVTIVSPEGVTLKEAYQLFLSVLNVKGYTIVPSGKFNKIVSIKGARSENLPTITDSYRHNTEQFVTRMVRLEHLDAPTVVSSVLSALVAPTGNIIAYPPTNTLIMTDTGANIERLLRIVKQLDVEGSSHTIEVLPLQNASAEEVAKICNEVIEQPAVIKARTRKEGPALARGEKSKIIPYSRTNSLIIMANLDDLELVKQLVALMDQETDKKRSNINLYYLENADAETLAKTLNEILTGIKSQAKSFNKQGGSVGPLSSGPLTITADKPTNSLIINASPEDYTTIKDIIAQLDIKRKQVYVEALIMELSMDATQRLGTSLQGAVTHNGKGLIAGGINQNTGPVGLANLSEDADIGVPTLMTAAIDGLLAGGFFNPITVTGPDGTDITVPSLSALIDVSKTDSDINILSAPRLLTSDNEEAEIIVGSNVPIITGRLTDTGSSGLAQSVAVERQDVALILRFTPQVTEGDLVRLNVYQELTDIVPASSALNQSVGDPNEVGPTFTKRVIRNTVLAENGKTVVLGGLIDSNITETVSKVPVLGDIPLLGWLFKRKRTEEDKTNLLIFINPTIIKDAEDLTRVTARNRGTASNFLTQEKVDSLPDNFFGNLQGSPDGGESQWVTPKPKRSANEQ